MKNKIKKQLEKIRPMLQSHGGDVEFVDFDEKTGTVKVKLVGMCSGCPMAGETLKYGIEEILKKEIKEIKKVISI
jgi:Fe-S cluster biogenesis protein NfuA